MPHVRGVFALLLVLSALLPRQAGAQTPSPAAPRNGVPADEIERIVRDYLLTNPEIVIEAIEAYRRKQAEAGEAAVRQVLADRGRELFHDSDSAVGGNPKGDVTLVEFFDYRCGVCKQVHPVLAELMKRDGGIRRVYKEWPILGPDSVFAARAALAARRQGEEKYLAFHDALMQARGQLGQETVLTIAAGVGLDRERLLSDLKAPAIDRAIERNFSLAEALRINGTPSFVIGDTVLRGAHDIDTLRSVIRKSRKPR